MKMNRVQFQPGLSMPEFYERCGTKAKCRATLAAACWPTGFACPALGFCAHQCGPINVAIFESTKLALSRWFLAM